MNYIKDYFNLINLNPNISSSFINKTILITGGLGAIGSNLYKSLNYLTQSNCKIIIIDNSSSFKKKNNINIKNFDNTLFLDGDIRDMRILNRIFREKIDYVFHLAAFFANQNSIDNSHESIDVDIIGLNNLLEMCLISNKDVKFIYASSSCAIYGSYPELPLKEDFISMHLTTPYQINKMTGEMYCNFYHHHYDLNIVNCRFFNSYGPGEVPGMYRNVIPNFIYWALNNKDIPITGDGNETRDFTYVLDLVQGLIKSSYYEGAIGQNFNLASGSETKIISLANQIIRLTNSQSDINYIKKRKWDTKPRLLADITKAKKLIDYLPAQNFDNGLLTTIDWFRKNHELINDLAHFKEGINTALRPN